MTSAATVQGETTVDAAAAWAAVSARDGRADGAFVYAVSTTRVYCRPACPSRRPRREHVAFFAVPADAEAAGYRACLRCRPRAAAPPAPAHAERARALIDRQLAAAPSEPLTLARLAAAVGVSPHHLQRTFKRAVGVSPAAYVRAARRERFKAALRDGETVSAAVYGAGFGSSSRAYDGGAAPLGMTPGAYRRGGAGVRLRYAVVDSPLGRLLVAATARGVCAATLGDDDAALEAALAAEYPRAERERADGDALADDAHPLGAWTAAVLDSLGSGPAGAVPTDVAGTPFEERVWAALRAIPRGETRSYAELAAAIGAPSAVRAVASACARNRVAVVIPCHRVVRAGGAMGGYRWGVARKAALLAREAAP
jgi:AraC family transcriptional regulator of adaptative response/methylated-DNA-[protein]-cysteine methyltransferase